MSHLSQEQLVLLRVALDERRQALRARVSAQLGGLTRAEHAREILLQDGDDATQRDADREVDLAVTDRDGIAFAALERALERIGSDRYGLCVECGEEIPFARLELEPQAERCVACATRMEKQAPRPPSL